MLGSHAFVASLFEGETLWSGLAIFIVSNYTVIVWVVIDLVLILPAKNLVSYASEINKNLSTFLGPESAESSSESSSDEEPDKTGRGLKKIRKTHLTMCNLVRHLDKSMSGLFATFYVVNIFFLWLHILSLIFPPLITALYMSYQAWATIRQLFRFVMVTSFAIQVESELRKPLELILNLPTEIYDQEAVRFKVSYGFGLQLRLHLRERGR